MSDKDALDERVPESCPHCGNRLSSWQQVLLKVDRAIVCKNCWYRIVLDVIPDKKENKKFDNNNSKNEAK